MRKGVFISAFFFSHKFAKTINYHIIIFSTKKENVIFFIKIYFLPVAISL